MGEPKKPALEWYQRREKVFVSWEKIDATDVEVTLSDGLLSLTGSCKGEKFKVENVPLYAEIDVDESKWFKNDRRTAIVLKKKEPEYWDSLAKSKSKLEDGTLCKTFIKADMKNFCDDDDPEYNGDIAVAGDEQGFGGGGMPPGMGMPGMGGMGGMDMAQMQAMMGGMGGMGGMDGMGGFDDDDEEDGDADLGDLDDGPPPLEGDAAPAGAGSGAKAVNPEDMEEVD